MADEFDESWEELPEPSEEFASLWPGLKDQNVNDLIEMYRGKRDELALARKVFRQKESNVKDLLARIGMALRDKADALGVTSFATPAGTAYRSVKKKYRVGDWATFWKFVHENNFSHLVEKRVGKLAAMEIHAERAAAGLDDPVPPGLVYIEEVAMDVRKPTGNRKKT